MIDYVHEHFAKHPGPVRRAIRTKRGTLSVQASGGHYCSPREDNLPAYTHVEVWWEGRCPRGLGKYRCGPREPAGWVPVEVVNRIIRSRGGPA